MTWASVVLAGLNVAQTVALAWIAGWQRRAVHERRQLVERVNDVAAAINGGGKPSSTATPSGGSAAGST